MMYNKWRRSRNQQGKRQRAENRDAASWQTAESKKPRRGNGPPPDLPPAGGEEKYSLTIMFNFLIFQLSYFLPLTSYFYSLYQPINNFNSINLPFLVNLLTDQL